MQEREIQQRTSNLKSLFSECTFIKKSIIKQVKTAIG